MGKSYPDSFLSQSYWVFFPAGESVCWRFSNFDYTPIGLSKIGVTRFVYPWNQAVLGSSTAMTFHELTSCVVVPLITFKFGLCCYGSFLQSNQCIEGLEGDPGALRLQSSVKRGLARVSEHFGNLRSDSAW